MENNIMMEQANKIVEQLKIVKDDYVDCKRELSVSIRRDLVAAELKDILLENVDYYALKEALDEYIKRLYKLEDDKNGE